MGHCWGDNDVGRRLVCSSVLESLRRRRFVMVGMIDVSVAVVVVVVVNGFAVQQQEQIIRGIDV
jgi:hypothetical protein